ncbi:chromatin-binding/pre-rRNA-processing protein [Martiniozyma asiatica (nom. inval.)]|nr:chromatin-binding/pre-rRNA-processing protein [Martiniozyma asiatica]
MDEIIYYNSVGNPADKKHDTAFSYLSSLHTTKTYHQYRQSPSAINGAVNLSIGNGSHLIVALPEKPIIHVYLYGKEQPEQRIPIPETLSSLAICNDPLTGMPTLLIGGSISGRLYIWSLNSGLLLSVKQPHYQSLTKIVCHSGFIATSANDSRVVIQSLVSLLMSSDSSIEKPFAIISDHTLPVTSLLFNKGLNNDLKLYTASNDSTVRCYSLSSTSAQLTTTFVAPSPVTSLAADPAFRALYFGMANGNIRSVPLYTTNSKTHIFEAVGGLGKIVTLKNDPDMLETFNCHAEHHKSEVSINQLKVSLDGTLLVSGDSKGSLFIIDISTKQISRKLKDLTGGIANLDLFPAKLDDDRFERKSGVDKSLVRSIPILKRVLSEQKDLFKENLILKLNSDVVGDSHKNSFDLSQWLEMVKEEEMVFTNFTSVDSSVLNHEVAASGTAVLGVDSNRLQDLQSELEQKEKAFNELRSKYDELLKEYSDVVTK